MSRPRQTSVSSVSVDSEDLIYSAQDVTRAVTLLVSGDEDGALILSIGGLFPVSRVQLNGPAAVAVACCASGDLQMLFVWAQTTNGPNLETFNTKFLGTHQREVNRQRPILKSPYS